VSLEVRETPAGSAAATSLLSVVLLDMDLIRSYYYSSTKQELLIGVIALEAFFTFPFIICSFVVAGTANAGFNCVLTGFLNVALAAGSYHVIKNSKAPIAVSVVVYSCSAHFIFPSFPFYYFFPS